MRKKPIILSLLLVAAMWFSACSPFAHFDFYPRSPRKIRRIHRDQVRIIRSRPQRSYVELGLIRIRQKTRVVRYTIESEFRLRAARMGADAVIIIEDSYSRSRSAYRRYSRGRRLPRQKIIIGMAIRFR